MSFRKQILVDVTGANLVLAGPTSGGNSTPTYRALVAADIPALPMTKISGWTDATAALNSLLPTQTGNSGKVLKTNGTNATWQDEVNQTITLSGDASGSGTGTITVTLTNSGVTAGTYRSVTVNAKGLVTGGTNPTTLAGYGITDAINSSLIGAANGVVPLDATSKISGIYLPASLTGALAYQGTWNASTNTPTIPAAAAGNKGQYYKVSVAGTTVVDTIADWGVGDWIVSNGTTWDKIDNTESVSSVAGRTGAIVLTTSDVSEGTRLYYTDARAIAAPLTGYTAGSNTALAATDTILAAMGKIQGQLNARLSANQTITLSGDASGSGTTSIAVTLPVVNSNVGTFNNVTVNAKGLVTAASNVAYLTANQSITFSGDASGSGTTAVTLTLANVGTAGTYRSVTTDAKGRVISGVAGSLVPVTTKTANYTATTSDDTIFVDASSAAVTITLPASPATGQMFEIKRIDNTANAVSINGNGKNIDEAASQPISNQYDCLTVVYSGLQWFII